MNTNHPDRFSGTLINPAPPPEAGVTRLKGNLAAIAPAAGSVATRNLLHGRMLEKYAVPGSELPTFTEMKPEANTLKTYQLGNVELRQSSTRDHQDGVAYNPRTETIAVTDGMGGVGNPGDVKNYFGFALAHAVAAEVEDVSTLQNPESMHAVIERTKELLAHMGIHPEAEVGSELFSGGWGAGRNIEWGATLAVMQKVPGTENEWRVAIFGDASVVKLGRDGKIQEGFGECFQLIDRGRVKADGRAEEVTLGSYVGVAKRTLGAFVQYRAGGLAATFGTVRLAPGEKLAATSDAYIQKTSPATLETDAKLTNEEWAAKAPQYDDDTTMAVVTGA